MTTKKWAFLALVAAWSMSACGDGSMTGPSALTGTVWKLQRLEASGSSATITRPDNYTIEFKEDLRVAIKADCNACGGTYSLNAPALQISTLACTLAFCGAESNDTAFLGIVNGARAFSVSGAELRIDSGTGSARFAR